jgi:hypothetical protein
MADIKETITLDDIKDVRDKLKRQSSKWAGLLCEKMYGNESDFKENKNLYKMRLYNIVTGTNRSNHARAFFILRGEEVMKELVAVNKNARKALENILS